MKKTKTQKVENKLTGEPADKIRVYTISREVDSGTKALENTFKNLKREFDFDIVTETFDIDSL